MAKLPRSPIAQDVRNNYSPVREARASSDDPVGAALKQAGDAAFEIGERMATAKINADMTKASIKLRSKLDAARREIENDMEADPATFEARFRERAAEIANEEAGTLSSPAGRKAFGLKAQEDVEAYSIRMRDVTRRRQVENVKADTLEAGSAYELLAKDPNTAPDILDATRADYDALIDRQVKAGIYTPDEAAAAKIASAEVYRAGVSTRVVTRIDNLLDSGDYVGAKQEFLTKYNDIDPAQREKVEDVLNTKSREGIAVQTADKLWNEAGKSWDAFIAEARKIENVDDRLAVEARGAQLKAQDDAAKAAEQDAVVNDGLLALNNTGTIPSSILMRADGKTREFLSDQVYQRQARARAEATSTAEERRLRKEASDASAKYIASVGGDPAMASLYLEGPMAWKEQVPWLYEEYSQLDPVDRATVDSDINKRRATGGTATASDKVFSELIKSVPMLAPKDALAEKYGDARSKDSKASAEEKAVRASLRQQADEYAARTGGAPLTTADRDLMIARAFKGADPEKYSFAPQDAFQVGARIREQLAVRNDLIEVLGREPTPAEIQDAMRALSE
jgi:hypothetical protein